MMCAAQINDGFVIGMTLDELVMDNMDITIPLWLTVDVPGNRTIMEYSNNLNELLKPENLIKLNPKVVKTSSHYPKGVDAVNLTNLTLNISGDMRYSNSIVFGRGQIQEAATIIGKILTAFEEAGN